MRVALGILYQLGFRAPRPQANLGTRRRHDQARRRDQINLALGAADEPPEASVVDGAADAAEVDGGEAAVGQDGVGGEREGGGIV